jgi:polyhydroxyalkanoate synthase
MAEVPRNRLGHPSPLIFHLSAAAVGYQNAISEATKTDVTEYNWQPELAEQAKNIPDLDPLLVYQSALGRIRAMMSGLEKWQTHPYQRTVIEPPEVWSNGSSRLLDFGQYHGATDPNGPVVLVVPSLINRAYILDLNENCSLLRFLAAQGLRPLLLDWGVPTDTEREFDLNSYVTQRLLPAIEASHALSGKPIGVLGYCMGGTLAAGLLSLQSENVNAFATIGSPWDFSKSMGVTAALQSIAANANPSEIIGDMGQVFGMVPTELFQQLFAMINPIQAAVKFRKFDNMDLDSNAANHFVAIEDWLADGVPLATRCAEDLLVKWNLNNATARGKWELCGKRVDLAAISLPTLHVCGLKDTITQLDVATAIAKDIPNAQLLTPNAGHVGMIAGSKAKITVWNPVLEFFTHHL